jgi:hypothetical protein
MYAQWRGIVVNSFCCNAACDGLTLVNVVRRSSECVMSIRICVCCALQEARAMCMKLQKRRELNSQVRAATVTFYCTLQLLTESVILLQLWQALLLSIPYTICVVCSC